MADPWAEFRQPQQEAQPPDPWSDFREAASADPWAEFRVKPGIVGHALEVGKGLIAAIPGTVGTAIQGAAIGARGFGRKQIIAMNTVDAGGIPAEADDPIGYQHMTPEQRQVARAEVERSIAPNVQDVPLFKAGEKVANVLGDITAPAPGIQPGLARDVGGGIGSAMTFMGLGMIPGVGIPLAGAAAVLSGTGEAVQEAVKAGASQEQIERAGRFGSIAGATDLVDALLPTLGSPGRVAGLIKRIGVAAVKSMFIEGGQEGLQQGIQNLIAKGIYDPNRDVLKDVPYSALVGALSGGIVGGGIGAVQRHPEAVAPTEGEIAAAGKDVTAPLETPPISEPVPSPVVAATPEAPTSVPTPTLPIPETPLPPGPVTNALEAEIQNLRNSGQLVSIPSADPRVVRGREIGDAMQSDILADGPLEERPQPFVTPVGSEIRTVPMVPNVQGVLEPGRRVTFETIFEPETITPTHSATLGELLPHLSLDHLYDDPASKAIANVMIAQLRRLVPNMPVHFVTPNAMSRYGRNAAGFYFWGKTLDTGGPILVRNDMLRNNPHLSLIVLHEATHAVTSNIMRQDPLITARVTSIMDETKQQAAMPQKEWPYGFTNEMEFIAEAFSNPDFQEFLRQKTASPELVKRLGLEPNKTLWESFIDTVRRILGMPNTPEVRSLLEVTIRTGGRIIDAQARQIEEMQNRFNKVEPGLQAVARQPETKGVYDMISRLGNHISDPAVGNEIRLQAGYADKMNRFYKYMVHVFQLGELNPHLVPLQRYLEKMRAAMVDEAGVVDASMRVLKDWVAIGRKQSEALTEFIDDVTNMVYRTPDEVRRGIARHPTPQEFNALVRKYKLNRSALDVFSKINKMFNGFLDQTSQLAMNEALKITDPVQRANAVNAVQAHITNLKARPYFPFMRYGRHFVLVRNQAGRVIYREHFEPRGFRSAEHFQNRAAEDLRGQYPASQGFKVEIGLLPESAGPLVGMPGQLLDLIAQKLKLTNLQIQALEQLRFEMAPAQSFRHRMQNKSYTKGYSSDFQRSFAQYFFHGAKWYVKTKYGGALEQDITDLQSVQSLTPVKRDQIRDFLSDHLRNNFLDPAQDFIAFKAGLVFYTLAYVPVSAVVNMSQVPMVSLPYLTAKFGPRATYALSKAIGTARNYYRKGGIAALTAAEGRALDYAIRKGRLDQTLGAELAAWSQGGNLQSSGLRGATARMVHTAVEKGLWMFSIAEKWNRRITFAAARELALAQPNAKYVREILPRYREELVQMLKEGFPRHEAEAILVASHVVDQTQFMSTTESRPRFMRGKLGSLFLYKRYMQGLLFLAANNKKDFLPLFIIMAIAMGGLGGVPGYDDAKEIARALAYRFFGKDFNLDREIRKFVRSLTDATWAPDQTLHGFARMGFGVPWLLGLLGNGLGAKPTANMLAGAPSGPDLSRSIGLGGPVLPVELGKLLGPPISDPSKMFGEQSARAGGVIGNLIHNFYRAIASKDDPGDFKRWELMMPRFAKNVSTAYRAYSEEKIRGRGDVATVRYDTRDPEHLGEIVGMAGGFQPRRLTAKWEELRDQSEGIKYWDVMRGMVLEQWASAVRAGSDPKEMERMRTATVEFNSTLPESLKGMSLTNATIKKSIETRLRNQELMEAGLSPQMAKIPYIREIQGLHPESVVDVRKVPR